MSERPIAFLDSGIGGVPYLLACRRELPAERYVYYADNAHFPYGERSTDELRSIVVETAGRLIEREHPRLIVVACNTASVVALEHLRESFAVPFVGVVPAIKPAAEEVGDGSIGVLATSRTVEDAYVSMLIRRFARDNDVRLVAAGGLVQLVEERLGSIEPSELSLVLREPVRELRDSGVRAVVLGCTHFIHVRDRIEELLGPEIRIVDSVEGVTRQTMRIAGQITGETAEAGPQEASAGTPPGHTEFLVSSLERASSSYRHLAKTHGFALDELHARHSAHR